MLKEAEEEISRKLKVRNIALPKEMLFCMFTGNAFKKYINSNMFVSVFHLFRFAL